jgi:hypothetical protein
MEKARFMGVGEGFGYGDFVCDVESQSGDGVHVVAISIPICLAWHVVSFVLGIATTVVVIEMVNWCEARSGRFVLRPWGWG